MKLNDHLTCPKYLEAALQRYSYRKKVFWKYAVDLQENTTLKLDFNEVAVLRKYAANLQENTHAECYYWVIRVIHPFLFNKHCLSEMHL